MNKNTKNIVLILAGVLSLGGAVFILIKNKKSSSWLAKIFNKAELIGNNKPGPSFNSLKGKYSKAELNTAERIYRLESANFTSNIYKNTNGAGIIAVSQTLPYGWVSLASLWADEKNKPVGLYHSSNTMDYVQFPSLVAGIKAVIVTMNRYKSEGKTIAAYCPNDSEYVNKLQAFESEDLITPTPDENPYY